MHSVTLNCVSSCTSDEQDHVTATQHTPPSDAGFTTSRDLPPRRTALATTLQQITMKSSNKAAASVDRPNLPGLVTIYEGSQESLSVGPEFHPPEEAARSKLQTEPPSRYATIPEEDGDEEAPSPPPPTPMEQPDKEETSGARMSINPSESFVAQERRKRNRRDFFVIATVFVVLVAGAGAALLAVLMKKNNGSSSRSLPASNALGDDSPVPAPTKQPVLGGTNATETPTGSPVASTFFPTVSATVSPTAFPTLDVAAPSPAEVSPTTSPTVSPTLVPQSGDTTPTGSGDEGLPSPTTTSPTSTQAPTTCPEDPRNNRSLETSNIFHRPLSSVYQQDGDHRGGFRALKDHVMDLSIHQDTEVEEYSVFAVSAELQMRGSSYDECTENEEFLLELSCPERIQLVDVSQDQVECTTTDDWRIECVFLAGFDVEETPSGEVWTMSNISVTCWGTVRDLRAEVTPMQGQCPDDTSVTTHIWAETPQNCPDSDWMCFEDESWGVRCSYRQRCTDGPCAVNYSVEMQVTPSCNHLTQQEGEGCNMDMQCASHVCIQGVCWDGPVCDKFPCEVDAHCQSHNCVDYFCEAPKNAADQDGTDIADGGTAVLGHGSRHNTFVGPPS